MSYVSFNINYLSHTEIIERGIWSGSSLFAKKKKKKKKKSLHVAIIL